MSVDRSAVPFDFMASLNLWPACGTAFSSVHPILSVCVYPLESQGSFWIVLAFNIFGGQQEDHPCAVTDGLTKLCHSTWWDIAAWPAVTHLRIFLLPNGMRLSLEPPDMFPK